MAAGKTVGRPPKYKSKEEIEAKIDAYFKECEGEILKDDKGKPIRPCIHIAAPQRFPS